MHFLVGTSGYSYPEWKGKFYPLKLPQREMLPFYAERFSTVEINNSFYRLPEPSTLKSWADQVPSSFRFALKAPQIITHRKRLHGVKRETDKFFKVAGVLKERLGPLLFQLPPNFAKDLKRLEKFLRMIAGRGPVAFEFRHASWVDAEVFDCLRAHACAYCLADIADCPRPQVVSTTDWGYIRLRRGRYTGQQLQTWLKELQSQPWSAAYVYFLHEETGSGPRLARPFVKLVG